MPIVAAETVGETTRGSGATFGQKWLPQWTSRIGQSRRSKALILAGILVLIAFILGLGLGLGLKKSLVIAFNFPPQWLV